MIGFAKATTREEDMAAAQYFAQQPYPRRIKVVESKTAPKVRLPGRDAHGGAGERGRRASANPRR